jgi:hypothetical protein
MLSQLTEAMIVNGVVLATDLGPARYSRPNHPRTPPGTRKLSVIAIASFREKYFLWIQTGGICRFIN